MKTKQEPQWLVILAFIAIYIVWGTTYLAILFGLDGIPPFMLSALRFFIAGIILFGWCRWKKQPLPPAKVNITAACAGAVMLIGGTGLVTWGEQYISSGNAAIIMAIEPFMFLLLDKKQWPVYFSNAYIIAGLIIGFAGIVLFFQLSTSVPGTANKEMQLVGQGVMVLAALLWVIGSLWAKQNISPQYSSTIITSIQMIGAGVFSAIISGLTGEWSGFNIAAVSPKAWGGLLYLITMGSLVAYLAFVWLITIRPPAMVSTHTYVNPIVAVFIGWAFASEHISGFQLLALLLILAGVLLTNINSYRRLKIAA